MDIITSRKKLGIKCVDVAHKDGNTIVLHGIRITMSIKRWRLYRRYVDSTTVSCINSLQEFDTEPNWRDVEVTSSHNIHVFTEVILASCYGSK